MRAWRACPFTRRVDPVNFDVHSSSDPDGLLGRRLTRLFNNIMLGKAAISA
jgi:hypothetical protein